MSDTISFLDSASNEGVITQGTFSDTTVNLGTVEIATFDGTASNEGSVDTATFTGSASNLGTVDTAVFVGSASNEGSVAEASFSESASNEGSVAVASFSDGAVNVGTLTSGIFLGTAVNSGVVEIAEFFGTASNLGTIVESAKFADSTSNEGTVSGSAIFADTSVSNGVVEGAIEIAQTATQGENQTLTETPTEYIQPDGFFPNAYYSGGSRTAPADYETVVYQVNGFWYKYDGSGNGSSALGDYSDGSSWFTFTKGVKGTMFHRFCAHLNNSGVFYYFDNEPTSGVSGINSGVPYEGTIMYESRSSSVPASNLTGSGDDFDSVGGVDDIFFTNASGEFSYTLGVNISNGFYSYGHYSGGSRVAPANYETVVHQVGNLWYKYDASGNAALALGTYSDGTSMFVFEDGVKGEAYVTPPEIGVYFTSNYTCSSPYGGCYGDYMNLGNWLNVNCDPSVTIIPSGADKCIIVSDNSSIDIPANLCLNTIILNGGCVVSPANYIFANIVASGDARVTSIGIRNGTVSLYNTSWMGDADICDTFVFRYDSSTRNNNIGLYGNSCVYDCRPEAVFHPYCVYLGVCGSYSFYYFDDAPTCNDPVLYNGLPQVGTILYIDQTSSTPASNLTGSGDDFDAIGGANDIFFTDSSGAYSYTLG